MLWRMKNYDEATYGENIAEVYDELYAAYDPNAIATLKEFAQGGPALELAIGTGRVALPLQAAGVNVHGIDASPAMMQKMQAKPGGAAIPVSAGNFADVGVDGKFSLIYVVFNTFYALLTQEEQLRCFANVAKHLTGNGVFVIEAFVPDLARFARGQNMSVVKLDENLARVDAAQLNLAEQIITSQHIAFTPHGTKMYPVKIRYAWPSELDLMARLAGLKLVNRWANWKREPFTSSSGGHVSVYAFA
jgi:SAM-dependent methyltransferase